MNQFTKYCLILLSIFIISGCNFSDNDTEKTTIDTVGQPLVVDTSMVSGITTDNAPFALIVAGGNGGLVTYSSSNENVATVTNDGLITIVGAGTSDITASEAKNGHFIAQTISYTLTVALGNGQALIAGADIAKTTDDAPFTQVATAGNGGVITYSSSDENIATVANDGVVTIVGAGTADITISEAQTGKFAAQTRSYTLTVVRISGEALIVGADVAKFTGDVLFTQVATGGNGGVITYNSSDQNIATVANDGVVTIVDAGTVIITISEAQTDKFAAQINSYSLTVVQTIRVESIVGNASAHVALHSDGSVTTWGNSASGGGVTFDNTNPVISIAASKAAFAALHSATITT